MFPYLLVNVLVESCNTLHLSGKGRRGQVHACLVMSLSRDAAVKNRSTKEQSSHGAAPPPHPGALPASCQGCPTHVSLTDRRHPSWPNHVTIPTATWATTDVFPTGTWTLGARGSCVAQPLATWGKRVHGFAMDVGSLRP